MKGNSKPKVILFYGGRSPEHEVSCRSASFVLKSVDQSRYELGVIAIDKAGKWHDQDPEALLISSAEALEIKPTGPGPLCRLISEQILGVTPPSDTTIFSVLHGALGENGSFPGLFECAHLSYVGPEVLGAAVAMNKIIAKRLVAEAGGRVVPYFDFYKDEWEKNKISLIDKILNSFALPFIVKPANLGSAVGVSKVNHASDFDQAVEKVFRYDRQLLVEKYIPAREIEFSMMGDETNPIVSEPGEVVVHSEIYSYESKYLNDTGATVQVPAKLTAAQNREAKNMVRLAYRALHMSGMVRCDLFLCKETGLFYFNEANTLPGFTSISQFPMLFQHAGFSPQKLVSHLIEFARKRSQLTESLHVDR